MICVQTCAKSGSQKEVDPMWSSFHSFPLVWNSFDMEYEKMSAVKLMFVSPLIPYTFDDEYKQKSCVKQKSSSLGV